MKNLSRLKQLILCLGVAFSVNMLHAGIPLWTFAPLTATSITVPTNATATIQYLVTNQSKKSHTLVMTPITGITQVTTPGNCSNPFVLNSKQSCVLTLEVNGSLLKGKVTRGPVVCQQGSKLQCYQPSLVNSLNINSTIVSIVNLLVAAGSYINISTNEFPLLAQSPDNGTSWSYTITSSTPTLPAGTISAALSGASCNADICIATGQHASTSTFPLLAQTTNGTTWSYAIDSATPTLPGGFLNGSFNNASCKDDICIAIGSYFNGVTPQPLLAQSTNNGTTWSYAVDSNPPGGTSGFLNGASCFGNICIAAGTYTATGVTYPLLTQSTDNGATWTYSIDSSMSFPTDFKTRGIFGSASCDDSICIAAGAYSASFGLPYALYPILAQSTDNGATWNYSIDSTTPALPVNYDNNGAFAGASCNSGICIAVGAYETVAPTQFPLLVQSTDNGTTWAYRIDSSTPALPGDYVAGGIFNSASCNDSICIAAGSYFNGSDTYPLLAQSTDNGTTWSYSINSSTPALPAAAISGRFNGVSCNANACIAAGAYNNNVAQYPLLAESTDNGVTWSYKINNITPSLPADFVSNGSFATASMSPASFMPNSLRFLYP